MIVSGPKTAKAGKAAMGGALVVQKAVRHGLAPTREEATAQQKAPAKPGLLRFDTQSSDLRPDRQVLPTGFEPVLPD